MNIWENAVITTKGLALISKMVSGNTLNITRAVTGAGYVTPGTLQNQTAVSSEKQELSFNTATYPEEGKCALPCFLTNKGIETAYTATQIGIYAEDPDEGEILYFIAQAPSGKGTEVPTETEMPGYSANWTFYFQFGQADGVNVIVDLSNAVTREEMETHLADTAPRPFIVMMTRDSETSEYSVDKTFTEITTAFGEGRDMRLLEYGSSMYQYELVRATASKAHFACNNGEDAYVVTIDRNNTVTKTSLGFLSAGHAYDVTAHTDIREMALLATTTANSAKSDAQNALNKANEANTAFVTATYTGDGNPEQFIDLGFTPSAVLITDVFGEMSDDTGFRRWESGGLALKNSPCASTYDGQTIEIVDGGFNVFQAVYEYDGYITYVSTNRDRMTYHYIAIR